ncbi:molybdopterin-dependent oxidoreductase [uncultured Senegalimassilia sp.]|uniref:molybdopterin-dependent oxidoreductase n=1 Tax=uncultured Senegalimassilia sp. TaxID=1714350 RepID=UPI00267240A3|nr:molybdopterin-dependent oxidoreductase [uncultured Senegalimassilia sp.]
MSSNNISRRGFLGASAAVMAGVAGLTATGCSAESSLEAVDKHELPVDPAKDGEWVPAACWHNCGGRCMNKVMVKDGAVVRQKTDDTHEDSFDYPQQRGCVRGKAQQQQCFGADRLKYPLKRKNWSPENPNGDLRGRDEWERISWDEAINYVGEQFKTIKEKYGNQAFLLGSYGSRMAFSPLLAWGGHTNTADTTSHGAYLLNTATTIGIPRTDAGVCNDRTDMLNADTIVFYASNPAWSAAGTPSYHYIRAKEAGVKFITVDPIYTASAQMLDAEWIPIRSGTDTAFMLGVASEMVRLDKAEGGIIDWEFLDKYTVGFDADHKPADLKEDVNFLDYLEGKYDGVKHDAAWASEICGVPVEKITWFAREIGMKNNVWMLHNFAAARCNGAENVPQLFMTLGAMGGHFGKPGNCTANNYHANAGNGGPALVKSGKSGYPSLKNEIDGVIPGPQVWEACLTGKYRMVGDWYSGTGSQAGEDRTCDIHCIIHDENAYLQTGPNMKRGIEAHRKMDFVLAKAQFMNTQAMYSDIVLPVTTQWEVPGGLATSNREFLYCFSQVTEPLYEAKTDVEINSLIMKAIGVDPTTVYPISEKQAFFNTIATATVIKDDDSGEYEPIVTITEADIKEWGVEGKPQTGRVRLKEFVSNGGYQVKRSAGDKYSSYLGYATFIKDPEANPLKTKSGKFEIACQAKADLFNSFGLRDYDYKPYPEYIVPTLGYETTFKDGKIGSEKGEYPYLLFNPHYFRRSHSVFDNCPWLREAWANPVFLNASDAEAKGIKDGDTVRVWTKYGEVLRKACCMENMIPGEVGIPHGSWVRVNEKTGIDEGGADNFLTGNDISGGGVTSYNNNNCNFEKYDGPALEDDCNTDRRIIELG